MKKQVAVIGLGRFGRSVARTLHESGAEVVAIDQNRELVESAQGDVTFSYIADASEERELREIGVDQVDVAIIAIGSDIQSSILTTMTLLELGVPTVIAKALDRKHGQALERLGVTRVVYPERDMGIRVAQSILPSNQIDALELSEHVQIAEIHIPPRMIGKSPLSLQMRSSYGVNLLAVKRGQDVTANPPADYELREGDILVIMGDNEDVNAFQHSKKKGGNRL